MDMDEAAPGFLEDAGSLRRARRVIGADPQENRPRRERGGEFGAVPIGGVEVQYLLERGAAEPRTDERRKCHGHRPARDQHEARERERRNEIDLVGKAGEELFAGAAGIARNVAGDLENSCVASTERSSGANPVASSLETAPRNASLLANDPTASCRVERPASSFAAMVPPPPLILTSQMRL